MHTNPSWKDYFIFPKKERKIAIGFVLFIVAIVVWGFFDDAKPQPPVIENIDDAIAKLATQTGDSITSQPYLQTDDALSASADNKSIQLFTFDPNTIDEAGFAQLGLREKTIHTIINYRNKGGHFYKPEDLRKIYGLMAAEADKLIPYVKIKSINNAGNPFANNTSYNNNSSYSKQKPSVIDINTATIEEWKALPAIGDALSSRIVKYRDKSGGFTSIEQVKKTYGLSDSAYQVILPYLRLTSSAKTVAQNTSQSQKININKTTAAELQNTGIISSDVAEAIIIYRKQHGNYASIADIKKIVFINDELYQKISPLLTAE